MKTSNAKAIEMLLLIKKMKVLYSNFRLIFIGVIMLLSVCLICSGWLYGRPILVLFRVHLSIFHCVKLSQIKRFFPPIFHLI